MTTILVIDDDNQFRSALRVLLEEAGHQVLEASDGTQGIKTYGGQPVALIFCDLFMPGKEGLETIREFRCRWPEVKIIAMSGGGYSGTVDCLPMAAKLGATRTLKKPFGMEALSEVLDEVLSGSGRGGKLQPERTSP